MVSGRKKSGADSDENDAEGKGTEAQFTEQDTEGKEAEASLSSSGRRN